MRINLRQVEMRQAIEERARYELRYGTLVGFGIGALATYFLTGVDAMHLDIVHRLALTVIGAAFEGAFIGSLSYTLVKRRLSERVSCTLRSQR